MILSACFGAFTCVTAEGVEFGAKGAMPNEALRQAWLAPEKWIGKMMMVKYFGKTTEGSLRFPSALRLHETQRRESRQQCFLESSDPSM